MVPMDSSVSLEFFCHYVYPSVFSHMHMGICDPVPFFRAGQKNDHRTYQEIYRILLNGSSGRGSTIIPCFQAMHIHVGAADTRASSHMDRALKDVTVCTRAHGRKFIRLADGAADERLPAAGEHLQRSAFLCCSETLLLIC